VSEYFTVETAGGRTAVPSPYFMSPSSYTVGRAAMVGREQNVGPDLAAVKMLVQNTHAVMTAYPFIKNVGLFYFLPHHMFSDPLYYRDFNNISLSDIVRYKYVVDSVCLSLKDGILVRDVRKKSEYPIDVQQ
jgi:hypothetical protein